MRPSLLASVLLLASCTSGPSPAPAGGGSGGFEAPGGGSGGTTDGGGGGGAGGDGGTPERCGDGACTAAESCASCAADCAPAGFGEPCTVGEGACERTGTRGCDLGCDASPGEPEAESCNGSDDDCDGEVDEEIPADPCDTGNEGICAAGELRCRQGSPVCSQLRTAGLEKCNAADDSCDGVVDEGCPASELARALTPWNGEITGARPTFTWRSGGAAARYRIQIDDSCPVPDWRACALPSPEVDLEIEALTRFTPGEDLPVSGVAPVGARYVWRLIECLGEKCSLTAAHYLDVGRQRGDLDGDGHADLLVGAPGEGKVYVFAGTADGFAREPSATLGDGEPGTGSAVALAGDVNGDGFADALVGADRGDEGEAWLLPGGPGGVSWDSREEIPVPADAERFGAALAGAGDVNGDGFADVVIGAPGSLAAGRVYVLLGSASGLEADPAASMIDPEDDPSTDFGATVSGAGDLDPIGGTSDVILAAPSSAAGTGKIYVWFGDHLDTPARFVMPPPNQIKARYDAVGAAAVVQREPGSSAARVLLGAPESTSGESVGAVVVLSANAAGAVTTAGGGGFRADAAGCGSGVAAGDIDGDGEDDTVMACAAGQLVVWQLGTGAMGSGTTAGTLPGDAGFGAAIAMLGDVDGDRRHDLAVGQPDLAGGGAVQVFPGSATGYATPARWTVKNPSGVEGASFGSAIAGGVR